VLEIPAFRMLLGLALGAAAAALVILAAERTNPRIDDPETAAALVGAPVLAMVPRVGRRSKHLLQRVDAAQFSGPMAESFRSMRSHLDFRARAEGRERPPRIMVTSATPSEGKSTTSAYLALSFVETDRTPVVVGGDLRRPTIHRLFGIDRVPGLTSRVLSGGRRVALTEIVRRDPVAKVTVVPSGPAVDSVADVLPDLKVITETAQASGQPVILDTAPVRVANDALDFLVAVDWVVVVVHLGRSSARSVSQMMHMLRMNDAQVVGVAVVGSAEAADASRDYYSYYATDVKPRRERRRRAEVDLSEAARAEIAAAAPTSEVPQPVSAAS
jgi:polysaccharide biosynthesis transport protein